MWTTINSRRVYYEMQGEGEPVLLLHGIPTGSFIWRHQIEALSKQYRVYAPDLLGWGHSDKPADFDYTISSYVEFVNGFLAEVNVDKAILIVHDLGGAIGLAFLGRYPEKVSRLVILDTFAYLTPWKRLPWAVPYGGLYRLPVFGHLLNRLVWEVSVRRTDMFVTLAFHDKTRVTRDLVDTYRELNRDTRLTDLRVLRSNGIGGVTGAVEQNSFNVRVPTLILWAENDLLFPPSVAFRLHANIRDSVLHVIPECGHFLQEEQPEAVSRALVAFLTDAWPPAEATSQRDATTAGHGHGRRALRLVGLLAAITGARVMLGARGTAARGLGLFGLVAGASLWRAAGAHAETVRASVVLGAPLERVWSYMSDLPFIAALPGRRCRSWAGRSGSARSTAGRSRSRSASRSASTR